MIILDVREPHEFAEGHAKTALNIPLGQLEAHGLKGVSKKELIIVYCRAGERAKRAEEILRHMGFRQVTNCANQDGTDAVVTQPRKEKTI